MTTRFLDGPARGVRLWIRRAPSFLRVTQAPSGAWGALDLAASRPAPDEVLYAYRRITDASGSRFYVHDPDTSHPYPHYLAIDPQPLEHVMRSELEWRRYIETQYAKAAGASS